MAELFDRVKDPADVSDWLATFKLPKGDAIATVISTVAKPDTITIDTTMVVGNNVIVWLSGGEAATVYDIEITITTTGGRTFQRTGQVSVEEGQ